MKKLFLSLILISFVSFAKAQAPNWAWAKSAGGNGSDEGQSICVDASGNSYVTGYFYSPTITFGTITLINPDSTGTNYDIFIAKYDASGNVVWAKSAGGSGNDEGQSICVDASGNSYITGSFGSATITFGTTTLTNNTSGNYPDIFIVKYDASGNVVWAKSAGGGDYDEGQSISVDANGNSYITGYFRSDTIIFGTTTLTNNTSGNYPEIFIAKYNASGNVLWAKSAGGSGYDEGQSISVDASGNSYITGFFTSPTITFGTTTLINKDSLNGSADIFIAKYDASGNVLWAKSAGGNNIDIGQSIAVDASGNSYITGYFQSSTITFGTITLTNNGSQNIFIAKYDALGNVVWAKSAGGNGYDWGRGISVDASGNSYITGSFGSATITFGTTTLINNDSTAMTEDIFIAKYDASGNVIWAKSAGGSGSDNGNSIAVDASGNSYITGYFESPTITFGTTTLTRNGYETIYIAKLDNSVGIEEINNNAGNIAVFPNPATDNITIETTKVAGGCRQEATIEITNIQEQLIKTIKATGNKTNISVSAFPSGLYFVKVETEKGTEVKKFIKE